MFELIKAALAGAVITFVVCLFIDSGGYQGGVLAIRPLELGEYAIAWSWSLFAAATALVFGLLMLMGD
ncbi:hypothetical protein [Paraurantiacibacter namhicola]|uniref:Uncharacterized protein n=1 Tax=Paraurantiacibacter namhicola TaxID=645517 RepID=A0A1C7D4G1_9SPHN|nr:hypothetical protein [Paraurantiacibacter namhicola]ANU06344.1 hypothetical protein A6F65_00016 [Paraurantiacibacter namhicola]